MLGHCHLRHGGSRVKLSLDTSVSYAKLCKRSGGSVLYGNGYNSLNEFSFEKIWEESKANLTFLVDLMNAVYGEEKSIEDTRQDLPVRYSFLYSPLSKYHNTLCLSLQYLHKLVPIQF